MACRPSHVRYQWAKCAAVAQRLLHPACARICEMMHAQCVTRNVAGGTYYDTNCAQCSNSDSCVACYPGYSLVYDNNDNNGYGGGWCISTCACMRADVAFAHICLFAGIVRVRMCVRHVQF